MQLLIFALLAFLFLMKTGLHPPEVRATNIDSDVVYRKMLPAILPSIVATVVLVNANIRRLLMSSVDSACAFLESLARPGAVLARGWSVASMMMAVVVLMCVVLVFNLI